MGQERICKSLIQNQEGLCKVKMIVDCFRCGRDSAVLTYEENRMYKVSCPCGCKYTFEHSSMRAASEYHCKMIELHAEIDKNSRLREQIKQISAERDAAISDMQLSEAKQSFCPICKHKYGSTGCPISNKGCEFQWRGRQDSTAEGEEL